MVGAATGFRLALVSACALVLASGLSCSEDPLLLPPLPDAAVAAAPAPAPEIDAGTLAERTARVSVVIGTVEVRRSRQDGWAPARAGDELGADDAIRTGDEGKLEIDYENIKLRVHERSEFKVKTLTQTDVRGRLRGQLDTEVPEGHGVVEIEAEGSDAVARTEGGAFSMTADGQGIVAVGSTSGWASLSAEGESVRIGAGMVSRVAGKEAPRPPSRALRNVLLSVTWPQQEETNQKAYPVTGKVEVGSRVFVGGQQIPVDRHGNFLTSVPLRMGKQRVAVVVSDVLGRKKRLNRNVLYDPTAPDVRLLKKPWSR